MSEITSIPTPGKKYKVKNGDWISRIAATAYGDGTKWPVIANANANDVDDAIIKGVTQVFFQPGDIVFIPELAETKKLKKELTKLTNKNPDDFTIIVAGRELPVQSAKIIRTMDTAADGWTAKIAWNPGADIHLDQITAPYSYSEAQAYIGNELLVNGILYDITHDLKINGRTKELAGFSFTADIIDSTMQPPYEKNNVDILQRAKELCNPHGISVEVDSSVEDLGGPFDRVTANQQDTKFAHLNKLAKQRSLLLSSTSQGDLLITRANLNDTPVGTLEESQLPPREFAAKFSGRKRFSTYRVVSQGPKKAAKKIGIAKDEIVPGSRNKTSNAPETTQGNIQKAAEWERSKQLVEALTIPFPVSTWYAPNGDLWRENTLVTVISDTLNIPNGFTFLIRQVEYIFEAGGLSATLSLVPPQVYSGEPIQEPWVEVIEQKELEAQPE